MEDLFINKKVWNSFSPTELQEYIDKVFKHYTTSGFPFFSTAEEWRKKELSKAQRYDYRKCVDEQNKLIRQTMHGLALCWSYHPYHYSIPCNNMRTVMDTFSDPVLLRKVIEKRVKFGDNMSDNGLRKMLKIFSGTQCVSNFRPTAAAAIYHHFCSPGDLVYDMSFGFGGRLLGAHLAGVKYVGVDPSAQAYKGTQDMLDDLEADATLRLQGSEDTVPLVSGSVSFCFTSPPYFDCEKYSVESTQSYIKFPTPDHWLHGFIGGTLEECYRVLKPKGKVVLNIQDVKSYPNLVKDIKSILPKHGFQLIDEWGLLLSNLAGGGYKTEPLLILQKR